MRRRVEIVVVLVAIGCGGKRNDGERALSEFREFVARAFIEARQEARGDACKFQTDVRATHAVAEPYEGLLHVDLTDVDGRVSSADLVFEHLDDSWVCSKNKSGLVDKTKPWATDVCTVVEHTCKARTNVAPTKKADARQ